jgi:methylenetetrahydrofolate reductase (NADPH)
MILVHNDFHQTHGLFPLFDGLEVENLEKEVEAIHTNGNGTEEKATNGINGINVNGINGVNGVNCAKPEAPLVNGVGGA